MLNCLLLLFFLLKPEKLKIEQTGLANFIYNLLLIGLFINQVLNLHRSILNYKAKKINDMSLRHHLRHLQPQASKIPLVNCEW